MFNSTKPLTLNTNSDIERYLQPTRLLNTEHPVIVSQARKLVHGVTTPQEKARILFYFIRDEISYTFRAKMDPEHYFASHILSEGRGFCTQKAILFCTLARTCQIPAGLYFYDIVDHTLPPYFVRLMHTNTLYHHGIVALYLNGRWIRYDATLHTALVQRNRLLPVEFAADHDCLMQPHTLDGQRHIEYVQDYGMHSDISFEAIYSWMKAGYPHLIKKG